MVFFVALCLAVTCAYSLDEETKDKLISLYNFTRDCYALIVRLVDNLEEGKIEPHTAADKVIEWKQQYHADTGLVPRQAEKMRDMMYKVFDLTQELADNYQPHYQETKDLLKELDEVKKELRAEMAELKNMLQ
jgi:hypothetical protein